MEKYKYFVLIAILCVVFLGLFCYFYYFQDRKLPAVQYDEQNEKTEQPRQDQQIESQPVSILRKGTIIPEIKFEKINNKTVRIREFSLEAENNQCNADKIIVNPGDKVKINFKALDKDYTFSIPDFDIKEIISFREERIFEFNVGEEIKKVIYYCGILNNEKIFSGELIIAADCEGCG